MNICIAKTSLLILWTDRRTGIVKAKQIIYTYYISVIFFEMGHGLLSTSATTEIYSIGNNNAGAHRKKKKIYIF